MTRTLTITLMTGLLLGGPAMAQTARYSVTFDATWTADDPPGQTIPPNPHFSGLVGGTHNDAVRFWDEGELASLGMKRMAEWGSQTDLLAEVQAAIDAGQAGRHRSMPPCGRCPGPPASTSPLKPDYSRWSPWWP